MTRTTPELAPLLSRGGRGHYMHEFGVQQAPTADLQWNRVSDLQPSGPRVRTLPLDHRGLTKLKVHSRDMKFNIFKYPWP
ncbi:hypothetical protein AVEN_111358-1 [Araneus ventricosus]|uniref:Uncharacterized protein n=1 Tax=Araneus ventricosus TaxID=182803 RepID=A0A4Y2MI22_ARAVE|nr:hypothetical protein AVEN_111358-1 [Araneus ventricosus]